MVRRFSSIWTSVTVACVLFGCGPRQALNPATIVGDDQTNLTIESFLLATIELADNANIPSVQFEADSGSKTATSTWNSIPLLIPLKEKIQFRRALSPPLLTRGVAANPDSPSYRLAAANYIQTGLDAAQLICSNYMSGLYDRNSYFEFLQRELSVGYGVVALVLRLTNANATLKDTFAGGEPLLDQGLNVYKDWRYLKINDENMRPLVLTAMQTKARYFLGVLNARSMTFGAAVNAVNEIEYLCTRAGLSYLINHGLSKSAENITFDPNTGALIFATPTTNDQLIPKPGVTAPAVKPNGPTGNQGGLGNGGQQQGQDHPTKPAQPNSPSAETDTEVTNKLMAFATDPTKKIKLAQVLASPQITILQEVKLANPKPTIDDILNDGIPDGTARPIKFGRVRQKLIAIARTTIGAGDPVLK